MDEIRYVFVPGWVRVGGVDVGLTEWGGFYVAESSDGVCALHSPVERSLRSFFMSLEEIEVEGW